MGAVGGGFGGVARGGGAGGGGQGSGVGGGHGGGSGWRQYSGMAPVCPVGAADDSRWSPTTNPEEEARSLLSGEPAPVACLPDDTDLQHAQGSCLLVQTETVLQRLMTESSLFPGMEGLGGPADSILSLLEMDPQDLEDGRTDGFASGPSSPAPATSTARAEQTLLAQDGVTVGSGQAAAGLAPIDQFLCDFASPTHLPLLPSPAIGGGRPAYTPTPPAQASSAMASQRPIIRSSGRLAAKPTYGLPADQKALRVLLKKSGVMLHDGPPEIDELQKYKEMYKKPLPQGFISAVSSLVAATKPPKPKQAGAAPLAAPSASAALAAMA